MTETNRPYSPSWVDRFTDWIESLPIPIWAFYVILYLIAAISLNVASWINGAHPWGEPSFAQFYNAIWLPLALFVIHNTDRVAHHALDRFGPLVDDKAAKLDDIRYQMTTMPARTVLWISIIAVLLLTFGALQDPELIVYELTDGPIHPITWILSALFGITSYSMAPLMIYHSIRQLNLVTKAYALMDTVNVFHQQPLYAFSGLTMRTALFLVGQVYITYVGGNLVDPSSAEGAINLVLSIVIIPLSIVVVLLPLWGIHQRLADAKGNVLEANSIQLEKTQTKLYAALNKGNYAEIDGLDRGLSSLYKVREQVKSLPTWPWAAGTFRNFLSAIFIPMLLWGLQVLLSRYVGS
ncbi:MAG: hypothetical protein DWG76_00380 [Chloroflexi bacterium]|nr:hypothetical protein [Chloroflexota bacterium]